MGVKGLWRLLLPIGRRISIETLEGRTLAVDASIWLTQFLKANRDPDTGIVRPAAHLIGFLRRICKLLYHGVRPVFVFDGPTPEIKLREIRARRERRERAILGVGGGEGGDDGAVKRMARKLLVAELAKRKEIEASEKSRATKGASRRGEKAEESKTSSGAFSAGFNLGEEEEEGHVVADAASGPKQQIQDESSEGGKKDATTEKSSADAIDLSAGNGNGHDDGVLILGSHTENDWDAAIPKEGSDDEDNGGRSDRSSSVQIPTHAEDIDLEAVLSLPPGDRKDIIEKARMQQRMRSRNEFMPVAADPDAYSQVQLRNFLRTSNLNKMIGEVGARAAKAAGEDGMEGERIASDTTRRFIFTKDKQETGADERRVVSKEEQEGSAPLTSGACTSGRNDGSSSGGSPKRLRRGLRRKAGRADARHSGREEDSDDDDGIFGAQYGGTASNSKSRNRRAVYSSSDDEGEGGFFVGDSSRPAGSPDPKRANYASHIRHDAQGWTIDESNVFATKEIDDSSDDEGGGFLAEDASSPGQTSKGACAAGRKVDETHQDGRSQRSAQILEDEMLARAIQETEAADESSYTSTGPSDGGFIASSCSGSLPIDSDAKPSKSAAVSSSRDECSDEVLAAQLQAEEDGKCFQGRSSSSTELRKAVDLTISDGEDKERAKSLAPERVSKPSAATAQSDSDESDEIAWEDGNEAAPDDNGEAKKVQFDVAGGEGSDHAPETNASDDSDEDVAWEDGNDASEQAPSDSSKNGKDGKEAISCSMPPNNVPSDAVFAKEAYEDSKSNQLRPSTDTDNARLRRRSSLSETYTESDGNEANDFDTPVENANVAALHQAEATAANLTNWAGRAVRRAIAAHIEERGLENNGVSEAPEAVADKGADGGFEQDDVGDDVCVIELPDKSGTPENGNAGDVAFVPSQSQSQAQAQAQSQLRSPLARKVDGDTASTNGGVASSAAAHPLMDTSLEALRKEGSQMQEELNRQQRDMDTVTDEMKEEIQELLRLFGIPYLEAPAEAESQCCALEDLGLVDGIVTEDSDAFVFGGKSVYKNIFDDKKYVEVYLARDAKKDLGLATNQMVALAMLLGGDYTDGVKGVGIVNGMEILQAFDCSQDVKAGLESFRQWLDGFDPSNKRESDMTLAEREFHSKHRSARTRWVAPKQFPSPAVLNAYQKPVVDRSDARFSWGTPDLDSLRTFCYRKMGWDAQEVDRMVLPVMKKLQSSDRQTRLESYFMTYEDDIRFANVRSKRLKTVLGKIRNGSATKDAPDECKGGDNIEEGKEDEAGSASSSKDKREGGKKPQKRRARSSNKKSKKQRGS